MDFFYGEVTEKGYSIDESFFFCETSGVEKVLVRSFKEDRVFKRLLVWWRIFCVHVPFLRPLIGMPTCLVFIRHAQSEYNRVLEERIFLESEEQRALLGGKGDHQIPLSEEGMADACRNGRFFRRKIGHPDVLIHSGHLRTKQTLAGMFHSNTGKPVPIYEDRRWRERDIGHTYQMLQSEADSSFPYLKRNWKMAGRYYARPPGGESIADVIEKRLTPAFADLYKRFAGKCVVIFTHGRVIQCSRIHLDEMSLERIEPFLINKENDPKNCSFTVYKYSAEHGKLVLVEYNTCYETSDVDL